MSRPDKGARSGPLGHGGPCVRVGSEASAKHKVVSLGVAAGAEHEVTSMGG
jgi:hypothetical protein